MFTKSKILRLLHSAAADKRLAQFSFKAVPGEDDSNIELTKVLEEAAEIIERWYEDHEIRDDKQPLRSVIGENRRFLVDKTFVFNKIRFCEGDVLRIEKFEVGKDILVTRVGKNSGDNNFCIPMDYLDLSDMYSHNFISYIKDKK